MGGVNRAQRIVLVIALAVGFVVVAIAANLLLSEPVPPIWFRMGEAFSASQTDDYFVVMSDRAIAEQAGIWLVAVTTWAGTSVWLLRSTPARGEGTD